MRAVRDGTSADGAWSPRQSASQRRNLGGESPLSGPSDITGLLGYRLHAIDAKIASVVIRLCEGRYGVSRREWHVLGLLEALGPQTSSQLASNCHLDRPRISRAISALAAKGLVARSPVAVDHKRAILDLTPSGRELQARLFADVASINAKLIEGLDDVELGELHRLLVFLGAKADAVAREVAGKVRADRWRGRESRTSRALGRSG